MATKGQMSEKLINQLDWSLHHSIFLFFKILKNIVGLPLMKILNIRIYKYVREH